MLLAIVPWSSANSVGDPVAGEAKAATCVACHGDDGNGVANNPTFPKLAGQVRGYLSQALLDYKNGQRQDSTMRGLVMTLTEEDIMDIEAYYLQFEASPASISEEQLPAAQRGREIYRTGLQQYSVPACMACHGPAGKGIPSRFPRVAGQYIDSLIKSLTDYKTGKRTSDEMNPIAFRLSESQIMDLAIYMHGLN